jgi:colanic acid biosynthesis glycosyl transferase WcaI
MKILVYGINFAPEPTGVGKYTGEMATWLAGAGHEVRAVAAPPYYPMWSVGAGYSAWRGKVENYDGVRVWRTPVWVPKRPSGLKRILHLASFAVLSVPALVRQMFWKPDVVIVVAPAFACAPGGWLVAKVTGAKAWLHIQDFEIDAAFSLGLLKGQVVRRAMVSFESWILRRFDRVSTISQRMIEVLHSKHVDNSRIVSFPNWVDLEKNAPTPGGPRAFRRELGIPDDAVVALFSGSMVGKQGLEILPVAARALRQRFPKLYFVLCGQGVARPNLERDCAELDNVRMLDLQPAERLGDLLAMADLHLLPQNAGAADLVMPSKLTGMLASGRPVVATARDGSELARVVTGVGLVVPPGNLEALTEALAQLVESPELRETLGSAARQYAEERLALGRVLADFEFALKRCVDGPEPTKQAPEALHSTTGKRVEHV